MEGMPKTAMENREPVERYKGGQKGTQRAFGGTEMLAFDAITMSLRCE